MAGVRIDPDGVAAYAKTMAKAADQLDGVSLKGETLGVEAFGELGRQVRTAEAYSRASSVLRDQLTRAVETLNAASDSLEKVAEQYKTSEHGAAQTIKRAENR